MNNTTPVPSPRRARGVVLAFVFALGVFTTLTVRDAGRPPVRPAAGGTYIGRDVDGRLVQVCLFEQDDRWQGWLYREGREQTEWFTATNRAPSWSAKVNIREREDEPNLPEPVVASTGDPLRLNATLPRTNGWANDTANLTRQFEHVQFRRLAGFRLGRLGGTHEFVAQFPRLAETNVFFAAVNRETLLQSEASAAEFTSDPFSFWKDMVTSRTLPPFCNRYQLTANWQLRLLTTNLASFCVWSYDEVGGNGNHSHWHGMTFVATDSGLRELKLTELLRPGVDLRTELRARCVPKLQNLGAPDRAWGTVTAPRTEVDTFTLSSSGLQIYFNPYILGSGADGEFVVHFDYAELKDLLRTNGPAALLPARGN